MALSGYLCLLSAITGREALIIVRTGSDDCPRVLVIVGRCRSGCALSICGSFSFLGHRLLLLFWWWWQTCVFDALVDVAVDEALCVH